MKSPFPFVVSVNKSTCSCNSCQYGGWTCFEVTKNGESKKIDIAVVPHPVTNEPALYLCFGDEDVFLPFIQTKDDLIKAFSELIAERLTETES